TGREGGHGRWCDEAVPRDHSERQRSTRLDQGTGTRPREGHERDALCRARRLRDRFRVPVLVHGCRRVPGQHDILPVGPVPDRRVDAAELTDINSRLNLLRSLLNSLVFTVGVLAGTLTFGLAAGYSLSRLQWRGRGVLFAIMLGVQAIPFQLLMIPL